VTHVDLRGRIVADQQHGETRTVTARRQGRGTNRDLGADAAGQRIAIDELSGHG
jgi:hypothetical protein